MEHAASMRLFARSSSVNFATLMLALLAAALTVLKPILMSPFRPVASACSACRHLAGCTSVQIKAAHLNPRQGSGRYPEMQDLLDCCWYALQGPCTVHLQSSINIICCQVETQLQIHQEAGCHRDGQSQSYRKAEQGRGEGHGFARGNSHSMVATCQEITRTSP